MNNFKKLALVASLSLIAVQAVAATDSVDVKVMGDIVPPACVPTVAGGAVFDFGSIKAASLKLDDFNTLNEKALGFNVVCDAPMKIAFKTADNRSGSAVIPVGMNIQNRVIEAGTVLSGFGMDGERKVGAYSMNVSNLSVIDEDETTLKGISIDVIKSPDEGVSWNKVPVSGSTPRMYFDADNAIVSLAEAGKLTPIPIRSISAQIYVAPVINKASELDLTKITNLDGMSSVQIIYL